MTELRLRYQTVEFGDIDIHLCTLRNNQEFHDPERAAEKLGISSATWPIFGVIWPSSLVLAHFLADYNIGSKRILEVGCGMALSSLLLNKLSADITATDYHPEAKAFLQRNTLLNGDKAIAFEQVDWAGDEDNLGRFDLIVGSDLLYEDDHALLLARFIEEHAKPRCEVVIVDPGRGRKNKLSTLLTASGFHAAQQKPAHTDYLDAEFKGHILTFSRP
ncbi:methyltransferase domain-containing protein [Pseudohalioglobus sediminis]|uniref:Methyltransferase domain-containing protein n=1 Tax=Pseudohalioglobus sediminis TaxID=2606449 RepID=A0A5B0WSE3_9GAMM|nr:methyltransferase domain-containing protein [Pseudohalioglobus sediminis]KAA1189992.1 methyltransferase domain-containing protein [Pseudohalioglobus sediminis]